MSYPKSNNSFPGLTKPTHLTALVPYVEYAADVQAEKIRGEVEQEDELRKKNATMRSPVMVSKTPSKKADPRLPPSLVKPSPNAKSPRYIKTAPISSSQDQAKVRESLMSMSQEKQLSLRGEEEKTSFEKAVEALAALKLHDYAVKRKEKLRKKYKLWEEIKGTRREFEIDGLELAMLESQEQIAAWKIKYYIQRYIEKKFRKDMEAEKRTWRKQGKAMQKKITTYQQEIEEYTSKNLENKNLQLQTHCVALSGQVNSLTDELTGAKSDIAALQKKMREQATQYEIKLDQKDLATEEVHKAHAFTKEELEISRRTCQEYVRNITLLEVQLQEIEREMRLRRMVNGEDFEKVAERNKELLEQVEALTLERDQALEELSKGDSIRDQHSAEMAGAAEEYAALKNKYSDLENENKHLNERIIDMSARLEKSIMEKKSLERLVTETTVKLHSAEEQVQIVRNEVTEREAVIGELEGIVNEREFEIEELKFRIFNGEECIHQANDFNEAIVQDNETLSMTVEDIEERYRVKEEQLLTHIEYARMLEMQLFVSRQRETAGSTRTTASTNLKMLPDPRYFSAPASFNAQFVPSFQQSEGIPKLDGEGSMTRENLEEGSSFVDPFRSISVVSHPLEERLSNLLVILEDKIHQIDNVLESAQSRMGDVTSRFGSKLEFEDWHQSRDDLEAALLEEKRRLENLKNDLSIARDDIHCMQAKKDALKKEYKKAVEAEKSGPSPPAFIGEEGSSVSEVVQDELQKLDAELHLRLTEAQALATEALNCKLECERLRRELESSDEEVEAEARSVRLRSAPQFSSTKPLTREDIALRPATRQSSQESSTSARRTPMPIPEASEEGTSVNSEHDDVAHGTYDEHPSTIEEKEESPADETVPEQSDNLLDASAVSYANITSADTSLFHQQSEVPDALDSKLVEKDVSSSIDVSKPEVDESSLATMSVGNASTVAAVEPETEPSVLPKEEVTYEEDFENDEPVTNNNLEERGETQHHGITAEDSVAEKSIASLAENSFASSTNAFRFHSQDLVYINSNMHACEERIRELQYVKEQRRREIELWMLDFLKTMNRMPTLSDSKYGTNRHLFVNFVQVQHEIIAEEDELESLVVRANQKLEDIADDITLSDASRQQFHNAFKDCILSAGPRTPWEDPFKLSFESVEQLLMTRNKLTDDGQSANDDDDDFRNRTESNIEATNTYDHGIIDMDKVDDDQREQLREELTSDIAVMHDDLLELRDLITSAQAHTNDLNTQLTIIKNQIMKWTQDFRAEHGRSPNERDKVDNIAHLYDAYQDTRSLLDEEVEHLTYLAEIAKAKATDREKLKHLLRMLTKDSDNMLVSRSLSSAGLQEASVGEIVRAISRDGNDANRNRQITSASSLDSDANSWKYIREGVEAELVKLNAELGILKSFLKTAENEMSDLRLKKNEIKRLAKEWLDEFIKEHNRHPTAEEKNQHAENLYDEYANVQEELSDILARREQATDMIEKMAKLIDAKNLRLQEVAEKEKNASRPATREYAR